MSDFEKAMRPIDSKAKQRVDENVVIFREMWEAFSPEERLALKNWVDRALELERDVPRVALMQLGFKILEQVGENEYRQVNLSFLALKNAMTCFDRGEYYAPTTMGELFG